MQDWERIENVIGYAASQFRDDRCTYVFIVLQASAKTNYKAN